MWRLLAASEYGRPGGSMLYHEQGNNYMGHRSVALSLALGLGILSVSLNLAVDAQDG